MNLILMNKNTPVMEIEYDEYSLQIVKVNNEINPEYAPIQCVRRHPSFNVSKAVNGWLHDRSIPTWRNDINVLLYNLRIQHPYELITKYYALSLADQYWLKPVDSNVEWKDINFFTNSYNSKDFIDAHFSSIIGKSELNFNTPNNTTDGMHKKAWRQKDNMKSELIKGGYKKIYQEPFNEVLATMYCERLGFDYVPYTIDLESGYPVSVCDCLTDENTEIITAYNILQTKKKPSNLSYVDHYVNILEENGIKDARERLDDMIVLDYLMMNQDRHLNNFGVIRNVETLDWVKVCPIFDTGQSMSTGDAYGRFDFHYGLSKFFENTNLQTNKLIEKVSDLSKYKNIDLSDIPEEWGKVLKEYKMYNNMSDRIIDILVDGAKHRVELFKENVDNYIKEKERLR